MGIIWKKEIDINLKYQIEEYYDNTPFIPLSKEKYVEYINGLIKKVQIKDNNDLIDKIKNYTLSLIMNSSNYLDFVDYYINQNYSFTLNLNKILDYFKDLEEIFDNCKEMININELINLPPYVFAGLTFTFLFEKFGFGCGLFAHILNNVYSIFATLLLNFIEKLSGISWKEIHSLLVVLF